MPRFALTKASVRCLAFIVLAAGPCRAGGLDVVLGKPKLEFLGPLTLRPARQIIKQPFRIWVKEWSDTHVPLHVELTLSTGPGDSRTFTAQREHGDYIAYAEPVPLERATASPPPAAISYRVVA